MNNTVVAYQQCKLAEQHNTIVFTLYINHKCIEVLIESNAIHGYHYYMKINGMSIQQYQRQYWCTTVYYNIGGNDVLVVPLKHSNHDHISVIVDKQAVQC